MLSYRIDFDGGGYTSAGQPLYDAGSGVGAALTTLMGRLGGLSEMAGKDAGGRAFAAAYDPAAGQLVQAGCALSGALQRMGLMVDTAAYNHQLANASSNLRTGNLPTKPSHAVAAPSPSTPPSASGGTGDLPGWWDKIKDHVSVLWPDADTGRLRDAAAAWNQAAASIDDWQGMCSVSAGRLESTRSPEIASATAALSRLGAAMHTLAGQYRAMASQCSAYADAVDRAHERANETITKFAWILGGTAVVAGVATVFTGPVGVGGGAVATGAEAGAAGAAVAADLAVAASEAMAAATAVGEAGAAAVEVASTARVFATATIEVAETASAAEAAGGSATVLQSVGRTAATLFDSYTVSDLSYEVTHGHGLTGEDGVNLAMSVGGFGLIGKAGKGLKAAEELADAGKGAAKTENELATLRNSVDPAQLASVEGRKKLSLEIYARARKHASEITDTAIDTTTSYTDKTYKAGFRTVNPGYTIAQVHHSIERQLRPLGLFTEEEIQALANLRGIPGGAIGTQIHQGVIRRVYDLLYSETGSALTREDVLGAVRAIDEQLGHLFVPPVP